MSANILVRFVYDVVEFAGGQVNLQITCSDGRVDILEEDIYMYFSFSSLV